MVVVFSSKPEEQYFETIEGKGPFVIVLGEISEHWTSQTLDYLKKAEVPVYFFPWGKIPELRIQLNYIRYPVVQLWFKDTNITEVVGHQEEPLNDLVRQFFIYKTKK